MTEDAFRQILAGTDYAYYQGDYYVEKDGKYVVVAPPVGAVVP